MYSWYRTHVHPVYCQNLWWFWDWDNVHLNSKNLCPGIQYYTYHVGYTIPHDLCPRLMHPLLLSMAVLANEFFPKFTSKIITVTPLIGVILTTLLCASPVSSLKCSIILMYECMHTGSVSLLCYNESTNFCLGDILDRASFRNLENPRSTANTSSGCSACCCICYWLLGFKIIFW